MQYGSRFIQIFVNASGFKKRLINVLMFINKQPITALFVNDITIFSLIQEIYESLCFYKKYKKTGPILQNKL